MNDFNARPLSRRAVFARAAAGAAALWTPPLLMSSTAFAEELIRTPRQTEGPFYPDKLPLDTDNDLLMVNETITPAVGEVTHLTGRVFDNNGKPLSGAMIEIWQCDNMGVYIHSRSGGDQAKRDKNFQGFGRCLTDRSGAYYFRTIKPVSYPGRTPHIHVMVKWRNKEVLTTQCYIKGHPQNDRDGVIRRIADSKQREVVMIPFEKIKDSKIGELSARFDIYLGLTPEA